MLICGSDLTPRQRAIVLARYVNRWTHENSRERYNGECVACAQQTSFGGKTEVTGKSWHEHHAPLISDEEWLRRYAFHFVSDGSRLDERYDHAEPL